MKYLLLSLILLPLVSSAMAATIRYADDGGTVNTGACDTVQSGASACTFARAVAVMQSGDTLQLADGTYNNTCIECLPSGTASTPTTLRSANLRGAILQPTSTPAETIFRFDNKTYITIDGVVTDCGGGPSRCSGFDGSANASASNITIQNNEIKNGKGPYGSGVTGTLLNSLIKNNLIHDNGGPGGACYDAGADSNTLAHGIYIHGTNTIIDNNEIYNTNCAFAITLYWSGNASANHGNIVRNNYIHDNPVFSIDLSSYQLDSGPNIAYNNIFKDNSQGIWIGGLGSAAYHNVVYRSSSYCFLVRGGNGNQIENNICLGNGNGAILDQASNTTCLNNMNVNGCNITQGSTDPFIAASSGNFHLAAEDGMGIYIGVAAYDRDNVSRTDPPDRGAYEFAGSGVTAGASIFGTRFIR